ncbi:MAG: hypothetical protein E7273_06285 [Pseudobutyrivibrio ruminis]|nr:hypothetical protein [Pseudobutyrivibrio ruminis]
MIRMTPIEKKTIRLSTNDEIDNYIKEQKKQYAHSYDEYLANGHTWVWCLVGNLKSEIDFGAEHEIRNDTKHFSKNTKLLLAPVQWGDGYERVVVIGTPKYSRRYIELIMAKEHIENFRMQKIYKPVLLKMMCKSEYYWWNDLEDSRKNIIKMLNYLSPEEFKKTKTDSSI